MREDVRTEAVRAIATARRTILKQKKRIAHLERLVNTDELTGILNRRGFQAELRRVLANAGRYISNGLLVCVDIDGFKLVNDTYGHAAGDEVLKRVSRILRENTRQTDYIGRLGGDEFAILLTQVRWQDGLARAGKIDLIINSSFAVWRKRRISLKASMGFMPYGPNDKEHDLLVSVDGAMYETKRLRKRTD